MSGEVRCCLDAACQLKSVGPAEPAKTLLQQCIPLPRAAGTDAACALCSVLIRALVHRLCVGEHPLHPRVGGSSGEYVKPPSAASGKAATLQNFVVGRRGVSFLHCTLLVETKKQQLSCLYFALDKELYLLAGILYLSF